MAPPHQRLRAHDVLLVEGVERLVMHLEFVPLEPLAQIGLDLEPLGGAGSHGSLVEHLVDAAPALGLGLVHRHVGVAKHVVGRLAWLGQGDADRHAGHQLVAVGQHHGLFDGGADAPRRGDRHVHSGHVLQQHHELVAAEAGQQVVAAHHPLHPVPDRHQELVAGHMAEAVVDALEAIHVDEDQRVGLAVQRGPPQRLIEALHQQPAVRQAGEAVVEGVMVEFVFEGLALGDVAKGDHRAGRRAVAHDRRSRIRNRDGAAVLAAEPGVVLPDGAARAHGFPGRHEQEVGRRQGPVAHRVVDRDVQRRQLDHVGRGPVDEGQLPVGVDGADAFADVERDRGEPLALDVDLLVQLGVAERPAAHGGQRPQQAPVGVVEGLIPAPARRHQPLLADRPRSSAPPADQGPGRQRSGWPPGCAAAAVPTPGSSRAPPAAAAPGSPPA